MSGNVLKFIPFVRHNQYLVCSSLLLINSKRQLSICVANNYSAVASNVSVAPTEEKEELVPEKLYSKINIKVQSFEFAVLDSYIKFVTTASKALGIKTSGKVALPTKIKKFTILKSPHIFKKHRVQYEIRTHSRLVQIKEITGTTADVFLEYIQRNLPEGVTMEVYQEALEALPKLLMGPMEGMPKLNINKRKK